MPLSGALTKNRTESRLRQRKGVAIKIQIAGERIKIAAKAIFNFEHEREGNTEEVEFQFKWER